MHSSGGKLGSGDHRFLVSGSSTWQRVIAAAGSWHGAVGQPQGSAGSLETVGFCYSQNFVVALMEKEHFLYKTRKG